MALVVVKLETLVSEPDVPITRPPPCAVESVSFIIDFKFLQ